METKKCPYCGGEIMTVAKKCKHCGKWLEVHDKPKNHDCDCSQQSSTDTKVEIKQSNTKKIILFVVGGLILAFIIWLIVMKNQKSDWEKAMDEYNSQSSYIEEAVPVVEEAVPYYGEGQENTYDGTDDEEYGEYHGNNDRTDAYDPNSSADAWE